MLKGSHQQVALEAAPLQQKLLLACTVLLMNASGKSEVEEALLRARHRAICMTNMHSEDVPPLPVPDQNEAIARLCAARLLDAAPTAGTLRLTVQPDDVRAVIRSVPQLAHLFPQVQ